MKYLLDTCFLSELVKKTPNPKVVDWVNRIPEDSMFISVLTVGEIQKGISKLSDKEKKQRIQNWLDFDLIERFSGRILDVNTEVALTWGLRQGELEQQGTPPPTLDGLIAATARAHNLTVVTRNTDDVERTGARFYNPWE